MTLAGPCVLVQSYDPGLKADDTEAVVLFGFKSECTATGCRASPCHGFFDRDVELNPRADGM